MQRSLITLSEESIHSKLIIIFTSKYLSTKTHMCSKRYYENRPLEDYLNSNPNPEGQFCRGQCSRHRSKRSYL